MSGWAAKRFWKEASAIEADGGYAIALDGRPVRTPAKTPLVVPTRALAEAIAAEWQAQGETVDPATMPLTRTANSALDKVAPQRAAVAALIADYGGTDLLCYRAEEPAELVGRQAEVWDALLDWAEAEFGARLRIAEGVMPVAQSEAVLAALSEGVGALDPWQLAAFHDLVAITGSLVLGFAVARGRLDARAAWAAARIDEDWQAAQWGEDPGATALAAAKLAALSDAERFWGLVALR